MLRVSLLICHDYEEAGVDGDAVSVLKTLLQCLKVAIQMTEILATHQSPAWTNSQAMVGRSVEA